MKKEKVAILPLSLYLDVNQSKAEREFLRLGVSWWALRWHYLPLPAFLEKFRGPSLPSLFQRYRLGRMTTNQFIHAIQQKFPQANITPETFKNAWNSIINVSKKTKEAIREANTLLKKGIDVCWLSGTNRMNIDYLTAEVGKLPGTSHFSFQKKKLENDLLEHLIHDVRKRHPNIKSANIVMFYTPPVNPHPFLGILAWFIDPINPYKYSQVRRYVANLIETARKLHFTLIEKPASEKRSGILSAIKRLGWFNQVKKKPKDDVTYLVRHKSKRQEKAELETVHKPKVRTRARMH